MASRKQLMEWARHGPILRRDEEHRVSDFLDLFAEQLERVCADPKAPMATEVIAARSISKKIWDYDRVTSDGEYIRTLVEGNQDLVDAQRRRFAAAEHSFRVRATILRDIAQDEDFLDSVRASIRGESAVILEIQARKSA